MLKKMAALAFLSVAFVAMTASAQQPAPDLVQAGVDAYNKHDVAYFEKMLAPDVVWLDEDGHAISGKERVLGFVRRQITATPALKLAATNVKMGNSSDAAWATFAYTIDTEGKPQKKGLNSTVFKKVGNDWQIVLVHGAVNTVGHGH